MQDLNVSVIQDDLTWQDPAANQDRYDAHIEEIGDTDLIVLPEMCSTGFSMHPWEAHEEMQGETVAWMRQRAGDVGAVMTGSLAMKLDDKYVNRMIWAKPDGSMEYYDKRHLFRFGGEHHHFTGGDERVVVDLKGWKIALFICYDLRFPVWSRNRSDYEVAVYVANWPNSRQYAWDTLVRARAIENQSYVLACNRLGADPVGNDFSGGSAILDVKGQPIVDCQDQPMVAQAALSMEQLKAYRDHFPASMDADEFEIRI